MAKHLNIKTSFELGDDVPLFGEAKTEATSLHEALCQAIHEGDAEAYEWLSQNVVDIN